MENDPQMLPSDPLTESIKTLLREKLWIKHLERKKDDSHRVQQPEKDPEKK